MLYQFLIKINMEMGTSETDRHLRWHPRRVSPQVTHSFVLLHEAGFSQDMSTVCHEEGGKGAKKKKKAGQIITRYERVVVKQHE